MNMKKWVFSIPFVLMLVLGLNTEAEAAEAPIGVKWGNSILIKGQIGKVTILKDTDLVKEEKGKLTVIRKLKKGSEFRVYSYKDRDGGIYGLGGGAFVKKTASVKYETPSQTKKNQIARLSMFQEGFLASAKKGIMKGQPIAIGGYEDLYDVYDYYGMYPTWEGYIDGGLGRQFGDGSNYIYYTGDEYDAELTAIDWWNDDLVFLTPYIIKKAVGVPTSEGISEMDGTWYMYYDCGYYDLYFFFEDGNRSNLDFVRLK